MERNDKQSEFTGPQQHVIIRFLGSKMSSLATKRISLAPKVGSLAPKVSSLLPNGMYLFAFWPPKGVHCTPK